jgi:hypothetical protein
LSIIAHWHGWGENGGISLGAGHRGFITDFNLILIPLNSIKNNSIGDKGAAAIGVMLQHTKTLTELA